MYSSNDGSLFYLILLIAATVGSIFLTRAIFSIPAFLRHSRAQTALLALMAEKQGVDRKMLNNILSKTNEPFITFTEPVNKN